MAGIASVHLPQRRVLSENRSVSLTVLLGFSCYPCICAENWEQL